MGRRKVAISFILFLLWPFTTLKFLKWANIVDDDENISALFPHRPIQDVLCCSLKCCDTYLHFIQLGKIAGKFAGLPQYKGEDFGRDISGMRYNLEDNLHGQTMAINTIIKIMHNQYNSLRLGQPISIEFYGPPGTGKGYASELTAASIFSRGKDAPVVHIFDGEDVQFTRQQKHLKDWIVGNLTECKKSMFIFKHAEKIPDELLEVVNQIMQSNKGGIFLFTTTEMSPVVSEPYKHMLKQGLRKNFMTHIQFKAAMRKKLFSIADRVIFLPMEERDLNNCMLDEFSRQGHNVPSQCMIKKVQEKFDVDRCGYTTITCADIVHIIRDIIIHEKC